MRTQLATLAAVAVACQHPGHVDAPRPRADDEGVAHVYLDAPPASTAGVAFELGAPLAILADGRRLPLSAPPPRALGGEQRLVGYGPLPAGSYRGVALPVRAASAPGAAGRAALLVPAEPIEVAAPFTVVAGRATVVALALAAAGRAGFEFAPEVLGAEAPKPLPGVVGWVTHPEDDLVTVFDKHAARVVAALATGRGPRGAALDVRARRGYLALGGADRIEVVDLGSGEAVGTVRLRPGDEPAALALAPGGRLLVALAEGARAAVLVDTGALIEVGRIPLDDAPSAIRLDRSGRRAWILSRAASTLTALDLVARAVLRAVPTEPAPVALAADRAGARLWIAHRGSQYVTSHAAADLSPAGRLYVGLGVTALEVDPFTDHLYVGDGPGLRLAVHDAATAAPLETIPVPAPVTALALDEVDGTLLVLLADARAVMILDRASRARRGVLELAAPAGELAVAGERR